MMQLFEPALELVRSIPVDIHVGLILRHSARFPILSEEDVYSAGLTGEGIAQAEMFGKALAEIRQPGCLFASPVDRCLDTALAISRGAGWDLPVTADYRLSHPFIEKIWSGPPVQWQKDPLPKPIQSILDLVLNCDEVDGTVDIFSTHDTVVAVLAGYFTGLSFHYPEYWPNFLEGVLVWRIANQVHLKWRQFETILNSWPVEKTGQMELDL